MKRSSLLGFAAFVWIGSGIGLLARGVSYFFKAVNEQEAGTAGIAIAAAIGLVIGAVKGRFVLAKSARRNKHRIEALPEPTKPWQVFKPLFYVFLASMMGMGIGLRFLFRSGDYGGWLSYGGMLCGIGGALFVSAFVYWFEDAFFKPKAEEEGEASEDGIEDKAAEAAVQ